MEIQGIRAMVFEGNFHSDSGRFRAITEFVADPTHLMEHRVEALARMYRDGMGFEEQVDAAEVEAYVAEIPVPEPRPRRSYNLA